MRLKSTSCHECGTSYMASGGTHTTCPDCGAQAIFIRVRVPVGKEAWTP